MSSCLSNITPDSLSGVIFALEGVGRSVVLLNGPTGCKFYHAAVSDNQTIRQFEFDPLNYPERWYFGQPRVPCTYLAGGDYIYGSRDKLEEVLAFIEATVPCDLVCIVNAPGAALIGDDLRGIAAEIIRNKPVVVMETPGFSSDICSGYERATIELFKQIPVVEAARSRPATVNLLGISIYHKYYAGDSAELQRLLGLCGITVNCVLCADCTLDSVRRAPQAALNIVIHPEYGAKTAYYLQEHYGTPCYIAAPPVGFAATEQWMSDICARLNREIAPFTQDSERARARSYAHISRINSLTGLPKGVSFSVQGTYAELYAYTAFLVRYFGMIPECLSVLNARCDFAKRALEALLDEFGITQALGRDIFASTSELVFASGNTLAQLKLRQRIFSGIEISLPSLGYIDVIPKTHQGIQGALMLTEQVINGLLFL
ncbi:MAG: nitrogenase component 1 [Peptococcaceae bacterium]|jgi:nitrogenase molybdenum-iron protein alpha/beta subunit|nr:nitrogenase component 1 [Peptococcaceae bacterium]